MICFSNPIGPGSSMNNWGRYAFSATPTGSSQGPLQENGPVNSSNRYTVTDILTKHSMASSDAAWEWYMNYHDYDKRTFALTIDMSRMGFENPFEWMPDNIADMLRGIGTKEQRNDKEKVLMDLITSFSWELRHQLGRSTDREMSNFCLARYKLLFVATARGHEMDAGIGKALPSIRRPNEYNTFNWVRLPGQGYLCFFLEDPPVIRAHFARLVKAFDKKSTLTIAEVLPEEEAKNMPARQVFSYFHWMKALVQMKQGKVIPAVQFMQLAVDIDPANKKYAAKLKQYKHHYKL